MGSVADSGQSVEARGAATSLVAIVAGAFLALAAPFVGVPLAAGGLAWLLARRRSRLAFAAAIVAGVATAAVDPAGPLYVMPWLLAGGPLAFVLITKGRFESAVLVVTLVIAAVWGGVLVGAAAAEGTDVAAMFRATAEQAMKQGPFAISAPGLTEAEAAKQTRALVDEVVRLLPAILAFLAGATAVTSVGVVVIVARRSGMEVRQVPRLAEFDLDPRVMWGLIVSIALMAADRFLRGDGGAMLGVVGENLLHVMRWILFAQGMAVFAGLYEKVKVSKPARAFGYTALVLTELLLPLVSLTGLVDIWFNLRKLPRDGSSSAGAQPSG